MNIKIKASDVMLLVAGLPVVGKSEDGIDVQIIPEGVSLNDLIAKANRKNRDPEIDYVTEGDTLYIEEPNSEE